MENAKEVARSLHAHWKLGKSDGRFAEALVASTSRLAGGIARRLRKEMLNIAGPYA